MTRTLALTAATALAAAAAAAQPAAVPEPTPTPASVGRKLVEIYRIAPGQHEAFLRAIARCDEVNRRAGIPSRQLYVHSDGASWDFLLIQDAEYPDGKGEAVGRAWDELGLPSGWRFFVEFRAFILEHTDTFAAGPTTAADWLAALEATPRSAGLGPAQPRRYELAASVALGGVPRWDYLQVDAAARRVYIAHDSAVDVVDLDARAVVGRIPSLAGAHGIALAPDRDRGFVASGDRGTVTAFDLQTLQPLGEAKVGDDPDSVTWEPVSGRVLAWNGGSRDVTVLDAASLAVLATVPLGGAPEFAVADGEGGAWVNIDDTAEVIRVDAARGAVDRRLPLAGCEGPTGLAIDPARRRLFAACGNGTLLAVDAGSGRVLARGRIGRGADAVVWDAPRARVLASAAEGVVSIFDVAPDGTLSAPLEVPTRATGRTMALDPRNGALLVPAADLDVDWGARTAAFATGGLRLLVFDPSAS